MNGWALFGLLLFIFIGGFLFGATFIWNRYREKLVSLKTRTIKLEEDFREVTKELEDRVYGKTK